LPPTYVASAASSVSISASCFKQYPQSHSF